MIHANSPPEVNAGGAGGSPTQLRLLEPLNSLDSFIQNLERCDQSARQLPLMLKAVAESVRADAVFIQSATGEDVFELAGQYPLTPEWCRQFLKSLLEESPATGSQLVRPQGNWTPPLASLPAPQSAASVQISKSRKTWVVALSFTPGRVFQLLDLKLMVLARRLLVVHARQLRSASKLKEALLGLIHCLTAAIDAKDPYTCGHSERVARIAGRIGQEMGLSEALLSDLYLAGLLHDIGKIGVEDRILRKAGKLTDEERKHMQEHPVIGDRIVAKVAHLAHVRPGVRNHHERYDGQGYPDRLVGREIPLMARVLAVADSFDAMMSARPYRPPIAPREIEAAMTDGKGTQWDPQVVDHFMACRQHLYAIAQRGLGDSLCLAVDHAVQAGSDLSWKKANPADMFRDDGRPTALLG